MAYLWTDFDIASRNTIRKRRFGIDTSKLGDSFRADKLETDFCGPIEKKKRFVSYAGRFRVGAKTM
jgi:hypothetical protein